MAAISGRALRQVDGGRLPSLIEEASLPRGQDQSTEPKFVVTNTLVVSETLGRSRTVEE